MPKRYLLYWLIATMLLITGCSGLPFGGSATATPIPFAVFSTEDVFAAFAAAGLAVESREVLTVAGRDEPAGFSERETFVIPVIAPAGGQILVFDNPGDLAAWQAYIDSQRNNSATRRNVIYVYVKNNVMLQLNSGLLNDQASDYREALEGMSF